MALKEQVSPGADAYLKRTRRAKDRQKSSEDKVTVVQNLIQQYEQKILSDRGYRRAVERSTDIHGEVRALSIGAIEYVSSNGKRREVVLQHLPDQYTVLRVKTFGDPMSGGQPYTIDSLELSTLYDDSGKVHDAHARHISVRRGNEEALPSQQAISKIEESIANY